MKSIYDQFKNAAERYPDHLALRFEQKTWSYSSLLGEIQKTAAKLVALGIQSRDVVAVSLPNCPEAVFLFYAISEIGAVSFNLHPLTPAATLEKEMEESHSHILFTLSLNEKEIRAGLSPEKKIIAVNPYQGVSLSKSLAFHFASKKAKGVLAFSRLAKSPSLPVVTVKEEDDAVYLNTGGTSGEPKIVRLSNHAINALACKGYPLIGGDLEAIKMLTAIPLFHGFGLTMGVHTPLSNGASSVLMLKFNTKEAIGYLKKGQATCIIGVPALYNALLSRDAFYGDWLQKQIIAFVGGDCVPDVLLNRWNETMEKYHSSARLYEGYGLTEAVNVANVNYAHNVKEGSIGKPLPGLKEIIIDPQTKQILPPGQSGEILIAGDTLMSGYLNDEDLTQQSFLTLEGTRYFMSQDYGYLDDEGYLYFRQRMRRIVKVKGESLCPSDLEEIALQDERIYDAYCYGYQSEKEGHVLRLAVVLRRGDHPAKAEAVEQDLKIAIAKKLPPVYQPDKIIFLTKLPRTPIGKIDDKSLTDLLK
jgi:long-chain acyl-CoA synthetase